LSGAAVGGCGEAGASRWLVLFAYQTSQLSIFIAWNAAPHRIEVRDVGSGAGFSDVGVMRLRVG
jgi:hypothetical protein